MSFSGGDGGGYPGRDYLPHHMPSFANLTPQEQLILHRQIMEAEDQHRRAIAQHLAAESHSMVCKSIFISKLIMF